MQFDAFGPTLLMLIDLLVCHLSSPVICFVVTDIANEFASIYI